MNETNAKTNGTKNDARPLVVEHNGWVATELFHGERIYQKELERIFACCRLYPAHESQLRYKSDYPMVVVRSSEGPLAGVLNSCRDRGPELYRADQGNSRALRCPHYRWTYNLSGEFAGVCATRPPTPTL